MNTHIIVNYSPFVMEQDIYVYSDGVCIKFARVSLDLVNKTVSALKNEYNAHKINLVGNEDFLTKFKSEMLTAFANDEELEIEILRR